MNVNIYKYGKGYPLVFFHGWGFDSQVWLPLAPRLMINYQLIFVDLPGFGHSSIMDWDFFKDILLDKLPEKFAVIGWSMGGLYAIRLAVEQQNRVDYLINVSSSPRFLQDTSWPGVSKVMFKNFHRKLSVDTYTTLNQFLELHGLKVTNKFQHLPDKLPTAIGLELGLDVLETWDFREELKHFNNPACFMFGRLDPIVSPKAMNCMQHIYPHFHYVLFKRAAHMPFLSHPDLFIEEIRGFVK
jgi:pimeloyl-[acyl-carrier protein] methyl ester esterase